ncbi:MAG: hypothetical protein WCK02_00485 [Bacteroidota bacterium]
MIDNNLDKYYNFRKQFPVFVYHDFEAIQNENSIDIKYHFEIEGLTHFYPAISIPAKKMIKRKLDADLNNLIFNIGLVESISYWKTTCSPVIKVKNYYLNKEQEGFWKKLFFNGLGEFFFLNNLNPNVNELFEFQFTSSNPIYLSDFKLDDGYIVPIGGGKDSAVTLQTLINGGEMVTPFILNSRGATESTILQAGFSMYDVLEIKRSIDANLLNLNSEGFLNGHTPFSALLAFLTCLIAVLSETKNIALSNESSANEPTIPGTNINHQYSKSLEFERDFRAYFRANISSEINYFSFLRPLNELQIAALLSKYDKYLSVFRSCNVGSKTDSWCGACPKCLFTFIMLSPFLEYEKIVGIFGKDLLNDMDLKEYFDELTGISANKPFECVGTISEVNSSILFLISKLKNNNMPQLLKYYIEVVKDNNYSFYSEILSFNNQHFLSENLVQLLKKSLNEIR